VIPSVFILFLDYALKIKRWTTMLRMSGAMVTETSCATFFFGSMALNNILPLRAGDFIRAFIFPVHLGISRTTSAASLILERLIDLFFLMLLLVISLSIIRLSTIPSWMMELIGIVGTMVILAISILIVFNKIIARLCLFLSAAFEKRGFPRLAALNGHLYWLLKEIAAMLHFDNLPKILLLSLGAWLAEAGYFGGMIYGFGLDVTPAVAVFVMSTAILSTIVPSSPGFFGPFHLAAFAGIVLIGGTEAQAGGYALLTHFCLWFSTTLAGAIALFLNPELLTIYLSKRKKEQVIPERTNDSGF
ncbi:MAG: h16, partial [Alphaproteobacteria bacterium]|nr:h16 [Alphaproteobacteria bacterium]